MSVRKPGQARKALTAVAGIGIGWAGTVIESDQDPVSAGEWLLLAIGVATALGIYGTPNDPAPWSPPDHPNP